MLNVKMRLSFLALLTLTFPSSLNDDTSLRLSVNQKNTYQANFLVAILGHILISFHGPPGTYW